MRVDTLPSPGMLSNGVRVRIEAAKAISAVEINAGIPSNAGKSSAAQPLSAFFTACTAALAGFLDVVVPTVVSRVIAASNTKRITLVCSEGMDAAFVPLVTDFAITGQVRTISKVTIDGPLVHLDVTAAFTAGAVSVAYTQGLAANRLRDRSGNLVVSFAATAVTNGIV
jgi:hypothetical protein